MFIVISCMTCSVQAFLDVSEDYNHFEAIDYLKNAGIIKGYADDTFKPENTINRAEAIKIILLGSKITVEEEVLYSGFSDVKVTDWFAPYTAKAKGLGIIKGNAEKLFLPQKKINLAEALKILILSNENNQIQEEVTETPYEDVYLNDWFAPYFVYAYEEKLLNDSKKIYPGHEINRAELAEIMYKLLKNKEKAEKNTLYASFYADSLHGETTASGDLYDKTKLTAAHRELPFNTKVEVTNQLNQKSVIVRINDRGPFIENRIIDLSKAAFEAISNVEKGIIPVSLIVLEETVHADNLFSENTVQEDCVWPENKIKISKTHFTNESEKIFIKLNNPLKTIFLENEVLDISGKISDYSALEITAFITNSQGEQTFFTSKIQNGNFLIQIELGEIGKKNISIIPGTSGTNYTAAVEVVKLDCEPSFSEEKEILAANNYNFNIENNEVILRWDIQETQLSKIIFKQADHEIIRYFSQGKKGWKVNLKAFSEFAAGEFVVQIAVANSEDGSLFSRNSSWVLGEKEKFIAIQHHHQKFNYKAIDIPDFSNKYGSGTEYTLKARTRANIRSEVAFITPSGQVESRELETESAIEENEHDINIIKANTRFTVNFLPKEKGTYIIEINEENGVAAFNAPIYEINSLEVPLIPDAVDLQSRTNAIDIASIDLSNVIYELLKLINQERIAANLNKVEQDEVLSTIANFRAEDMAQNNYLSHWDLEGQDVNQIRILYGVNTSLSENLAQDINVFYAHEGLMRSAIHRRNILNDEWERVGLGIAKTEKNLIVVELFSSNPILKEDVPEFREKLLEIINTNRKEFLIPSATLNALSQNWSDKMSEQRFFDFVDLEENTLSDEIRESGLLQTVGTFILGNSSWQDLEKEVIKHEDLLDTRWKKIGIGINQDKEGVIKVTLLYSE